MKFFMGIIAIIFVVVIAIVLFSRGGKDNGTLLKPVVVSEEARDGVSAVLTTYGQVVGEDQRRAIRVIVNNKERRLEILSGYEDAVERSHTFANTQLAFENFLVALDQAGYNKHKITSIKDERGACPLGRRYDYELRDRSQQLIKRWNTSCGNLGDFDGKGSTIRTLFEKQIDDYSKLVRGASLTGNNKLEK